MIFISQQNFLCCLFRTLPRKSRSALKKSFFFVIIAIFLHFITAPISRHTFRDLRQMSNLQWATVARPSNVFRDTMQSTIIVSLFAKTIGGRSRVAEAADISRGTHVMSWLNVFCFSWPSNGKMFYILEVGWFG